MIIVSAISAILAGMGIGGGALFIILSTLFLGIEQKNAQTLNLLLFIMASISATISNLKDKKIDFDLVRKTVIYIIIGSAIGTYFANKINSQDLKKYFLYFLVAIGIYEIITSLIRILKAKNNTRKK